MRKYVVDLLVSEGESLLTGSNGVTTPFPKLGKKFTANGRIKIQTWLLENAQAEAERSFNELATLLLSNLKPKKLTVADRLLCEAVLEGV